MLNAMVENLFSTTARASPPGDHSQKTQILTGSEAKFIIKLSQTMVASLMEGYNFNR